MFGVWLWWYTIGIVVLLIGVAVFGFKKNKGSVSISRFNRHARAGEYYRSLADKWRADYYHMCEKHDMVMNLNLERLGLLKDAIIVVDPEVVDEYREQFQGCIITTPSKIRKMNISAVLNS